MSRILEMLGGMKIGTTILLNTLAVSTKAEHVHILWTRNSIPRHKPNNQAMVLEI